MKRTYLLLLLTFYLWGCLYVANKFAFAAVPPLTVILLRNSIGLIFLFCVAVKQGLKRIRKKDIPLFLVCGFLGYFLNNSVLYIASAQMPASVTSLINSSCPLVISLLAVIFLKEKLTRFQLIGLACSLVGVVVVVGFSAEPLWLPGVVLCLLSVLFWSTTSILLRKLTSDYSPVHIGLFCTAISLPFSGAAAAIELQTKACASPPSAILALLFLGIFGTGIPCITWNYCLSKLGASTCSLFYPLQPLFATLFGILLLNEAVTINFIIGALLISAGVVIGLLRSKSSTKVPAA